jgi:hypothetical protein
MKMNRWYLQENNSTLTSDPMLTQHVVAYIIGDKQWSTGKTTDFISKVA